MTQEALITISSVIHELKLKINYKGQSIIGVNTSDAYFKIFNERPVKKQAIIPPIKEPLTVSHYPEDFKPIIINCINSYLKTAKELKKKKKPFIKRGGPNANRKPFRTPRFSSGLRPGNTSKDH